MSNIEMDWPYAEARQWILWMFKSCQGKVKHGGHQRMCNNLDILNWRIVFHCVNL